MHRIIASLFNSILDYVLWSDSRSGHTTQLRTYVALEWKWRTEKPSIFLVLLCYSKPFILFTNTSRHSKRFVLADKHYCERSLIHSAKRGGETSSVGAFCSPIFFLLPSWTTK